MNRLTEHLRAWLIFELHTSIEPLFDSYPNEDIFNDFVSNDSLNNLKDILRKYKDKYKNRVEDEDYLQLELDIKILKKLNKYYGQDNTLCMKKGGNSCPYYIFLTHFLRNIYNMEPTNFCAFLVQAYALLDYKFSDDIQMRKYLLDMIERKEYTTLKEYVDMFITNKEWSESRFSDIYKLEKKLDTGTYKRVYLGRNIISGVLKAISIFDISEKGKQNIREEGITVEKLIKRESHTLEMLRKYNPVLFNLLKIYDVYYDSKLGKYFLVTEYIKGDSLENILKKHISLPKEKIIKYASDVMNGLIEMRKAGIWYHRDLRPANIMVDEEKDKAVIIDFGIATTDKKASPKDNRRYGGFSDIVSLGQIIYKMATGEHLFAESKSMEKTIHAQKIKDCRNRAYAEPEGILLKKHLKQVDSKIKDETIKTIVKKCLTAKNYHYKKMQKMFEKYLS